MQLTYFDIIAIVIILLFAIRGGIRGLIAEFAGIIGIITGLALAITFSEEATEFLSQFIAENAAPVIAFIALFLAGMLVIGIIARIIQHILNLSFAKGIDAILGVLAGAAKGMAFCIIPAYGALMLIPHVEAVKNSCSIPYLMEALQYALSFSSINIPMP